MKHICSFCGKEFDTGYLLGNHVSKLCSKNPARGAQKNTRVWRCNDCMRDFPTRAKLYEHRAAEHKPVGTHKFYGSHPDINKPCRYCGRICTKQYALTRHEKYCKENPNREVFNGHPVSEATKKKLSKYAVERLKNTHCNWINKEKSYAEEYFDKIFTDAEKQYRVDRYILDYAWPKNKTYIEVDGEQHYTEKGLEHDRIREARLRDKGWTCRLRIRWSHYTRLSKIEKRAFLIKHRCIQD